MSCFKLFVLMIAAILSSSYSTSVQRLPPELLTQCTKYNPNKERYHWNLLKKDMNTLLTKTNDTIHQQVVDIIDFISKLSQQNVLDDTAITKLLEIKQRIRFSEAFLIQLPKIINQIEQQWGRTTESAREYAVNNFGLFDRILFGKPNYDTFNASITFDFPFTKLLLSTSRTIKRKLEDTRSNALSSQLDCWRLLYGFIFKYWIFQCKSLSLPQLRDIYYLHENLDLDHKRKQWLFIEELTDKFGIIVYHDKFIYGEWSYGSFQDYMTEYQLIRTDMIKFGFYEQLLNVDYLAFRYQFDAQFLLQLLKGTHYNLQQARHVTGFKDLVSDTINTLFAGDDHDQCLLFQIMHGLRRNNGLRLLKQTNVIHDIMSNHNDEKCISFLEMLFTVNSRYGLKAEQISKIAEIFNARCKNTSTVVLNGLIIELCNDGLFDENIINELINVHLTFEIISPRGQSHFIVRIICILTNRRNDWNITDKIDMFNSIFVAP